MNKETVLLIGDIYIKVNLERKYFHKNLLDFCVELLPEECECIVWNITTGKYRMDESKYRKIMDNTNLKVYTSEDVIIHKYCIEGVYPSYITSTTDFKFCTYYVNDVSETSHFKLCMFNVFREMYLCASLFYDKFSIHSSSIIYKGRGYAFCGPSGTGKTTHTAMWKEDESCEILDGDIALAGFKNGIMHIYGLPWCGTSGQYMNKCVKLSGLVFLEQSCLNQARLLSKNETVKHLVMNNFSFPLTKAMALKCGKMIEAIVDNVDSYILMCRPDKEAVRCIKECLD